MIDTRYIHLAKVTHAVAVAVAGSFKEIANPKLDVHYTTTWPIGPCSLGFPIKPKCANPKLDVHYTTIWPIGPCSLGFSIKPKFANPKLDVHHTTIWPIGPCSLGFPIKWIRWLLCSAFSQAI